MNYVVPLLPSDFPDGPSVDTLLGYIFEFAEHEVSLYAPVGQPLPVAILNAENNNELMAPVLERPYYRHMAGGARSFSQIAEASPDGVEYYRARLHLTESKRRNMSVRTHLEIAAYRDRNPLILKPTFAGVGVDLLKACKWLKRRFVGTR